MKLIISVISLLFGMSLISGNFTVKFDHKNSYGNTIVPNSVTIKIFGLEELTFPNNSLNTPLELPAGLGKEFEISQLRYEHDVFPYSTGRIQILPDHVYTIYKTNISSMCDAGDTKYNGLCVKIQESKPDKEKKENQEDPNINK